MKTRSKVFFCAVFVVFLSFKIPETAIALFPIKFATKITTFLGLFHSWCSSFTHLTIHIKFSSGRKKFFLKDKAKKKKTEKPHGKITRQNKIQPKQKVLLCKSSI